MIPWLLQRIEAALNYESREGIVYNAHSGFKLVALIVSWTALLSYRYPAILLVALGYPLLLHILAGSDKAKYAFVTSIVPAGIIGVVSLILSPYKPLTLPWLYRSIGLTLRVYGLASVTLLTFSTTPPTRLASLVSRKLPLIHDTLILTYRLAPLTTIDLARAYISQRLLGKGLRDPLIGAVLQELYRAKAIEVSLYSRGIRPGKPRSPMDSPGSILHGFFLLATSIADLILVVLLAAT